MKKIAKVALTPEGVYVVNQIKCDGIELQLFKNSDFKLIEKIKPKIITLHYDYYEGTDVDIEGEMHFDFYRIVMNENDRLREICKVAEKLKCAIVLHGFLNYRNLSKLEEFIAKLKDIHRDYPHVKFCIENTGILSSRRRANLYERTEDIPNLVKFLNDKIGYELCYPLLDITHYFQEFSSDAWCHPTYSLADAIASYNSKFQCIHFNYGLGDCSTSRHSLNFESNRALFDSLMTAVKCINDKIYLIAEVNEIDYNTYPNMRKHMEDMYNWEQKED